MIVYLPPLPEYHLTSGNGATGFAPDLGPTGVAPVVPASLEVPSIIQGHKVLPNELNVVFFNANGQSISPYSLTFEIGFLSGPDKSVVHVVGSETRVPTSIRVGRFYPSFQVGDKWFTGDYLITWKYKISADSAEEYKETLFRVCTSGIYDSKPHAQEYSDVSATVVVVGD